MKLCFGTAILAIGELKHCVTLELTKLAWQQILSQKITYSVPGDLLKSNVLHDCVGASTFIEFIIISSDRSLSHIIIQEINVNQRVCPQTQRCSLCPHRKNIWFAVNLLWQCTIGCETATPVPVLNSDFALPSLPKRCTRTNLQGIWCTHFTKNVYIIFLVG